MNPVAEIFEAIARVKIHGEEPDTIRMTPEVFDKIRNPSKCTKGTNRMKKRARFRSKKRVAMVNRMLDNQHSIA